MLIYGKDKNTVIELLEAQLKLENITIYRLDKDKIISRKTYNKMKKNSTSGITVGIVRKLIKNLNFSKKNKEILEKIIFHSTNETSKIPKNDEFKKIINKDIEEIKMLVKELSEEIAIKKIDNFDESYLKNRKINSFNSDLENRTLLINAMWDFNNIVLEKWKDFNMLLSINNKQDNIKMKKGLLNIATNLKEIAKKIETAAFDKDDFNKDIIIDE